MAAIRRVARVPETKNKCTFAAWATRHKHLPRSSSPPFDGFGTRRVPLRTRRAQPMDDPDPNPRGHVKCNFTAVYGRFFCIFFHKKLLGLHFQRSFVVRRTLRRHPNAGTHLFLFAESLAEVATSDCSRLEHHFTQTIALFTHPPHHQNPRAPLIHLVRAEKSQFSPDGGGSPVPDCPGAELSSRPICSAFLSAFPPLNKNLRPLLPVTVVGSYKTRP